MLQIKLFFFVLSIVYGLKFVVDFLLRLRDDNPEPMVVTKTNQIFLLVSISYIITYCLTN
jgi:hypothetical protein